ncbi:Matrix metallo ase-9 [Paramuricea clavata]|uniref:Matrix metallo ase-9 n=1 Tax=Paramuricea clavata TaxID=317549 RepID=A0A6S7HFP2_PARCT|nr:Matrix metallo ase-9 [Paramuricea clavata]
MDILLWSGFLLAFCEVLGAAKLSETYEKFYTTDASYRPTTTRQHNAMGISTLAKFSMLSNTPTLFKVRRPGLNNDVNTVSLESIQKPGLYLRYKNYKFHMEKNDDTELFQKDATFHEKLGPRGRAYELLGRDSWFMCHTDTTPYTLKARSERIGTQGFVNNCVYVPVKQDMVEKKNIVKTLPTGGAMVVNHVPTTLDTDKCISIRFVNQLGGPVRVVSSLKPEGYLVTANAFKLKTIFKHANHKQRHVIFYAENVQDRDDDVMLNKKNVFTIKPRECLEDFQNVVLSSQSNAANSDAAITEAQDTQTTPTPNNDLTTSSPNNDLTTSSPNNDLTKSSPNNEVTNNAPIPPPLGNGTLTLPALNDGTPKAPATSETSSTPPGLSDTSPNQSSLSNTSPKPPGSSDTTPNQLSLSDTSPKPPASSDTTPKPQGSTATPSAASVGKTTPTILKDAKPTAQNNDMPQENPNVPASELALMSSAHHATPKPNPTPHAMNTITANEIGVANVLKPNTVPAWVTPNPNQFSQSSYTAPLKQQIQSLDNVLRKRIQTQPRPVFGSVPTSSVRQNNGYSPLSSGRSDGYETWSSYGPCSVSCGVGTRRRSRVCRPGFYCIGPAAETRACIKEQCASNCIHTIGGTVREGSCCHFPFSYNGAQYYHCILSPKNNERMWCATTPYFEQDKQWGYCPRSAKAPVRSFIKPVKPVTPSQEFPQSQTSPYDNNQYYSNPYMTEDDSNVPCNAMCSRVCDESCPKHCCLTIRADLPMTAYMGNNYDRNDKRSNLYRRYRRNLSQDKKRL